MATRLTGYSLNVKDVATPKLPPPPPLQAQNSSGRVRASQVTVCPEAVTSSAAMSWSEVSPNFRELRPTPPPNVSPATPTVGQDPAGMATP